MDVSLFDFVLPDGRIALRPAVPRDSARMLVVAADGRLEHKHVSNLPNIWRLETSWSLMISKVISARLHGRRLARTASAAPSRRSKCCCAGVWRPEVYGARSAGAETFRRRHGWPWARRSRPSSLPRRSGGGRAAVRGLRRRAGCGHRGRRGDAPAALYRGQAQGRRAGHRGLPDRLRARGRLGGRADGRAAFHAGAASRRWRRAAWAAKP